MRSRAKRLAFSIMSGFNRVPVLLDAEDHLGKGWPVSNFPSYAFIPEDLTRSTPCAAGLVIMVLSCCVKVLPLTLTLEQLCKVLANTIEMCLEYADIHGYDRVRRALAAIDEILEGLDTERELVNRGEITALNQLLREKASRRETESTL